MEVRSADREGQIMHLYAQLLQHLTHFQDIWSMMDIKRGVWESQKIPLYLIYYGICKDYTVVKEFEKLLRKLITST
jgi:hypothetical protein